MRQAGNEPAAAPIKEEKTLRDAQPEISSSQKHQVIFPLAVAAIFVVTLVAGALL